MLCVGMVHRDLKLENILLSTAVNNDRVDMLHIKVCLSVTVFMT